MPRTNQNVWLGCAGVAALALTGCQSSQPAAAPGALPNDASATAGRPDKTPTINASTYFAHGHLLERQGAFDRALEQYRRVLELQPDFIGVRNRMGITLNKLGKHADATTQFKLALQKQPNSAYLHNNLGFSLFLEKRYDEARPAFEKALELKPDFSRARMNYGVTLGKLGSYDQAFEQFTKVCAPADAYYNLGVILTEAGSYGEAARNLEQALAINPKLDAARVQLNDVARLAADVDAQMKAIADAKAAAAPPTPAPAVVIAEPTPAEPAAILTSDDTTPPAVAPAEPDAHPVTPEPVSSTVETPAPPVADPAAADSATPALAEPTPAAPGDLVPPTPADNAVAVAPAQPAGSPDTETTPAVISDFETQAVDLAPFGESASPFGTQSAAAIGATNATDPFESLSLAAWTSPLPQPIAAPVLPALEPVTPAVGDCDAEPVAGDPALVRAARIIELMQQMLTTAATNVGEMDIILSRLERQLAAQRPTPALP